MSIFFQKKKVRGQFTTAIHLLRKEEKKKVAFMIFPLGQLGTQEESYQYFPTKDSSGLIYFCTAPQSTEAKAVCTPSKGLVIIHLILKG